ncbi:MAG: (Fe-S)-binding protein [Candidatus Eisenbacteria bacterium]|nr:(Fe-S)-binding protein [Candidatus Eisenbacteria bacterium]
MATSLQERFELLACIQCGRCTAGCPVSRRTHLNVRKVVYEGLTAVGAKDASGRPEAWNCTTCSNCTERCPKGVKPMELLIGLRSAAIEKGKAQPTIRDALESTLRHGNPWGRIRDKRMEWAEGLDVPVLDDGGKASLLLYVGCTPAYDPRVQAVARALVAVLKAAGVEYATLGTAESCCGSEIKRMGEEGLFELLVEGNREAFANAGVRTIIAASPHCMNTFRNEYGELGIEVLHYSQFLAGLLDDGRLTLTTPLKGVVTYHDPCFLGKHNDIFDEPRAVLGAIPGIEFVEMDRSRERALCCEGGGGRMWVEPAEERGERLADVRVKDAAALGAARIVTACPFCLKTLDDAVKTSGNEGRIEAVDLAELVALAL